MKSQTQNREVFFANMLIPSVLKASSDYVNCRFPASCRCSCHRKQQMVTSEREYVTVHNNACLYVFSLLLLFCKILQNQSIENHIFGRIFNEICNSVALLTLSVNMEDAVNNRDKVDLAVDIS